jgi:hypothetical protein
MSNMLDKGLSAMTTGIQMDELGKLMYPVDYKGLKSILLPAAWSIAVDYVQGGVEALGKESVEAPAPVFKAYKLLQAISPTSIVRMTEAVELAANGMKVYDRDGNLIRQLESPLEIAQVALAGPRAAKEESTRMHEQDVLITTARRARQVKAIDSIANKIAFGHELSAVDLDNLQSAPGMCAKVQNKLLKIEVPSQDRLMKSILASTGGDPELALMRWEAYNMFIEDARMRGEQEDEVD